MPYPDLKPARIRLNGDNPSDTAVFEAMNLDMKGLEAVKAAVEKKDYPAAYKAWGIYFAARKTPVYSVDIDNYGKGMFWEWARTFRYASAPKTLLSGKIGII